MSNVRIPHLEDLIFEGTGGIAVVLDALEEIAHGATTITSKWDVAPAVICGQHPQTNQFFVSTKSFWNVNSKVNYTVEDIERNHPDSPGLQSKLIKCLTYLPELGIKGVLQGDMMYEFKDLYVDGKDLCFKPNIIEYRYPMHSDIAVRMCDSAMGIVFHTAYGPLMEASYNVDIGKLNLLSKNVWFRDASIPQPTFSKEDRDGLLYAMWEVHNHMQCCSRNVLNWFQVNESLKSLTKKYINDNVRKGKSNYIGAPALHNFITAQISDSISEAVKPETKANRRAKLDEMNKWLSENAYSLDCLCKSYNMVVDAKKLIMHRLGDTVTEGYVVSTPSYAVKLVEREKFSYENFNSGKNWK